MSSNILEKLLNDNPSLHLNDEEEIDYCISSGSLILDSKLGGGFRPGFIRFCGSFEAGKTNEALKVMQNHLETVEGSKGLYFKAEGRLSHDLQKRFGIKFVKSAKDWVAGTCFVLESNVYEFVMQTIYELVEYNEEKNKYCMIVDSVDGLITSTDMHKDFYESHKVAGGSVIASNFAKRMSSKLGKRGHLAIFISQVRANVQIEYSSEPTRQIVATGGNALLHYSDWILEFRERFKGDQILEDEDKKYDEKKNPHIGHWANVIIKKSTNETTNSKIKYPIRYGRTNGNSIWIEKEIVDLLLQWSLLNRKGSWCFFTQPLLDELKGLPDIPQKLQGILKVFKFIEDREDVKEKLYTYLSSLLTA
jgi:RecA/RadA recombinase